ncbi:hypothetical protein [Prosthecobacter debontii]|nr:hypothetical protein [Prosthecobacter debontii]
MKTQTRLTRYAWLPLLILISWVLAETPTKAKDSPGPSYDAVEFFHVCLLLSKSVGRAGYPVEFHSALTRTRGRIMRGLSYWSLGQRDSSERVEVAIVTDASKGAIQFQTLHGDLWLLVLSPKSVNEAFLEAAHLDSMQAWFQELHAVGEAMKPLDTWEAPGR